MNVLGDNLSIGERQLISIARVVLRKSKIILIDEPTSNIDEVSEKLVTEALENCFQNSTVITIAHKIKTIMSSNKILVVERG